ncbi:hypothetical protein [Hyalangium rubrum]|uniref:Lipoprotein n=1 Tax=Hyalangium rubrum TaxID=3103134 RepID=A0ABU5GYK2_9BACT|nr:hypothetical protein [Hyalangium sp. s54d21]MDY7226277.1 hypothetical protein [Hyalangium sp. s54d21]
MNRELKWVVSLATVLLVQGCKKEEPVPPPPPPPQPTAAGTQQPKVGAPAEGPRGSKPVDKKAPEGCNSDFSQRLEVHHTLTEQCSPYTLKQTLSVDGWDLTIEPGVEIRIEGDQRIEVGYNQQSRLIARGTAEKPIRFVSNGRKEPGAWRKISLYEHAAGSTLEHVLIEHAGRENEGALENNASDVRIKNVRFVGNRGRAYQEDIKGRTTEFSDNDVSQSGGSQVIVRMAFESAPALQGANKWPDKAVVQLVGRIEKDLRIPNPGVPYRVTDTVTAVAKDANGTVNVKIAPGVVFEMAEETKWDIGYAQHGHLEAVGTAEQPIVFTGFGDAKAGSWRGLTFFDGARAPVLEHVRIEHAGQKGGAAVRFENARGLGKVTHVTIRKSQGYALSARGPKSEGFTAFSDNTFEEIARATLRLDAHLVSGLGAGNKYPQDGAIEFDGKIESDAVLTAQGVPYRVLGDVTIEGVETTRPTTLTLEPGVVVQFEPEARFSFGYERPGVLSAVGTAEKPITFTAATQGWKGLNLYSKGQLQLEHAVVEKVTDGRPGIHLNRGGTGGTVKNVAFKAVKLPIRNCVADKLTLDEVEADPGVKVAVKDGC